MHCLRRWRLAAETAEREREAARRACGRAEAALAEAVGAPPYSRGYSGGTRGVLQGVLEGYPMGASRGTQGCRTPRVRAGGRGPIGGDGVLKGYSRMTGVARCGLEYSRGTAPQGVTGPCLAGVPKEGTPASTLRGTQGVRRRAPPPRRRSLRGFTSRPSRADCTRCSAAIPLTAVPACGASHLGQSHLGLFPLRAIPLRAVPT
jgi:hypothetical protein